MASLDLVTDLIAYLEHVGGVVKSFDILGLGNPILDISANVPKELLEKYGLSLDNAILAEEKHLPVYGELTSKYSAEFIAGGATLNSIRVAQWMLQSKESTAYIGCVGKDQYGSQLIRGARDDGVAVHCLKDEKTPTGTCAVLIHDKERSLVANLAAANNYKESHLKSISSVWKNTGIYYSAGFFLTVSPSSMMEMAKHAKETNSLYCLNLSAEFLVQFFEKPMMELMPYVDILFGNESEALAFGKHHKYKDVSIKAIALKMSKLSKNGSRPRLVVITQGSDDVVVVCNGKVLEFPVPSVSNIVDTNGAGDAFVGGFLAAKSVGLELKDCVDAGIYASGVILRVSGTSLSGKPAYGVHSLKSHVKCSLANLKVRTHSVVADPKKAVLGRKKITFSKIGMEGLQACYEKFGTTKPLKGARISSTLPTTAQTAVLIEILSNLGAQIRCCSSENTQDATAAAIAAVGIPIFAWENQSSEEYWWSVYQCLSWPTDGPNLILDHGGDATLLVHEGVKAEAQFKKDGSLPDPNTSKDSKLKMIFSLLQNTIKKDSTQFTRIASGISGVSDGTPSGSHQLHQMAKDGTLLFPAIDINGSVTNHKFVTRYGARHSIADGIMRATDVMICGKRVMVCGFGDVGKGCAETIYQAGARVFVSEIDPICALQASMDGLTVSTLDQVIANVDIVITATGTTGVVKASHMGKMKNNCVVCNIGGYGGEIDMAGLAKVPGIKSTMIKPGCHRWQFSDGHGVIILGEGRPLNTECTTGQPSIVMSVVHSNQLLAQLELFKGTYSKQVHLLPKMLDETVARFHVNTYSNADITELSNMQAEYIGVAQNGPYKPLTYRY